MSAEERGAEQIRLLGEGLRRRRREIGLSQEQLAELCGLPRKQLSALERGHATRQLRVLAEVCDRLGLRLAAVERWRDG